ncbi:hypothetical protein A7U60_g4524 [Sanghuangporus baumii]|uniref:Uncharacterized protein n=1 Tax=Sanghuangporus baumii TaxID=108892 RepID=A0A9Q5N526_SANBA|nr:hypothetical protein A7U60_g4524 [Sanghuangporus baumii]
MRPTLRVLHVHKPSIHFLGKRKWPATPEPPHAHPAGPEEYKAHFSDFLKKFEASSPWSPPSQSSSKAAAPKSSSASSSNRPEDHDVYQEFWQAPPRVWNPRARKISDEEMEAILSGGASLH